MIRKFKALGVALLTTSALSAAAASGASADVSIFHSAAANTILTGTSENNQVFTRGALTVTCSHAQFEGTMGGTSTFTIEIKADYTTGSCTGPLNSLVHVDFTTGKCGFHFTGTAAKTAAPKLACAAGGSITLTATNSDGSSLCTIHILPQDLKGHILFSHIVHNSITSVTAEATALEIVSTRTGSALCGAENHATGTLFGRVNFTGYEDKNPDEGNQVAIHTT